jgi:hypothetical protein
LRGKPTLCRVAPGRPALVRRRGGGRPSRAALLGMTELNAESINPPRHQISLSSVLGFQVS